MVKNENNIIKTDIFYKVTDTHQYLHFKSCHPRHCKLNVPYNLARRICTIVSDPTTQDTRLSELRDMLLARKYPKSIIENGIEKAKSTSMEVLRSCRKKDIDPNIIPFVHTYNPNNPNMFKIIQHSLPSLCGDKTLEPVFKDIKFISSKRQAPNLKRILTRAALNRDTRTGGVKRCNDKRCKACPYMNEVSDFLFKGTSTKYVIKCEFTCWSKNLL